MPMRSGYAVTIKGFIPSNPNDLDGHAAILKAIQDAKSVPATPPPESGAAPGPSADPFLRLLEVEDFTVKAVRREAAE